MRQLQEAQRRRRRNTRTIPIIIGFVAIAVVLALVTGLQGSSKKKSSATTTTVTTVKSATPCPSFTGTSPRRLTFSSAPPDCLAAGKTYSATMFTNEGNITVQFDTTKTPKTADNFIVLSLYHYFDGTKMFRTDTSIGIIQGGSPHTEDASDPGPGYTIQDEGTGFTYAPGDLVMARTSSPNSASAQYFFCVTSACSNLNSQGTYVVFAHVTSGLSVLQKILGLNVNNNSGLGGSPRVPVTISKITISES